MQDDSRKLEDFLVLQKIREMAYDYAVSIPNMEGILYLEDRQHCDPNPTSKQTARGFFLEISKGRPYSIWSPWGEWRCWGRSIGDWNHKCVDLLGRLGAQKYGKARKILRQMYPQMGSLYAITSIDGDPVPAPAMLLSLQNYAEYSEVMRSWDSLIEMYREVVE
jgi:hypothetical protein